MIELAIILLLGVIYTTPFKGVINISDGEDEFMRAYTDFGTIMVMEETKAEELIGGTTNTDGEDTPTLMAFGDYNETTDTVDINLEGMGK